jgi:hypothetical protein
MLQVPAYAVEMGVAAVMTKPVKSRTYNQVGDLECSCAAVLASGSTWQHLHHTVLSCSFLRGGIRRNRLQQATGQLLPTSH